MLYGPVLTVGDGEDIGILLPVGQLYHQMVGSHLCQRGLIENAVTDIGLLPVAVQIDHVAPAEIALPAVHLVAAEGQRDEVISTIGLRTVTTGDGQVGKDAARLQFLGQRHLPQVGRRGSVSLLYAQFITQLFAVDEGHHPLEVGTLYGGER